MLSVSFPSDAQHQEDPPQGIGLPRGFTPTLAQYKAEPHSIPADPVMSVGARHPGEGPIRSGLLPRHGGLASGRHRSALQDGTRLDPGRPGRCRFALCMRVPFTQDSPGEIIHGIERRDGRRSRHPGRLQQPVWSATAAPRPSHPDQPRPAGLRPAHQLPDRSPTNSLPGDHPGSMNFGTRRCGSRPFGCRGASRGTSDGIGRRSSVPFVSSTSSP